LNAALALDGRTARERPLSEWMPSPTKKQTAAKRRAEQSKRDLEAYRRRPTTDIPLSVRHCYNTGARDWWIHTEEKAHLGGMVTRVPYCCGSWRCPICKHFDAHQMFARIHAASEGLDPTGWCFFVLTLDRNGTYSGEKRWENAREAYKELGKMRAAFFQNLRRWMAREKMTPCRNRWVATTEAHKEKTGGWPHMNLLVWSPELAEWLRKEKAAKESDRVAGRDAILVSRELADVVDRAGFGIMSTAEAARSGDAVAGYITKIAGKVDQTTGEITKLCQLPYNAPLRFRRLATGKGFLPPRKKNDAVTGTLVRRQRNGLGGGFDVLPVLNLKPELWPLSERACALEDQIFGDELEALQRCKRQVKQFGPSCVEIPPVTRWLGRVRLERGPPHAKVLDLEKYLANRAA
jgi:hypothetical protein